MIKFCFSLLFLTLLVNGYSQSSICENFDNPSVNCPILGNAFYEGCIDNWISTSGTPSLETIQPFEGPYYAHMYVDFDPFSCQSFPDQGEGIALNFSFVAGNTYSISYALRGEASKVRWILTDGLQQSTGSNSGCPPNDLIPPIPTNHQIVDGLNNFDSYSDWVVVNETFTPNADFNQLWFRPTNIHQNTVNSQVLTIIHLDAVCIETICDGTDNCTEVTDLTACEENKDFGFIYLDCKSGEVPSGLDFDWEFPAGSMAIEVSQDYGSAIIQATEGTYAVTITDELGCTSVRTFVVEEDCCEVNPVCEIPSNLSCGYEGRSINFEWDAVPGAMGYEVSITMGSLQCCGTFGSVLPLQYTPTNSLTPVLPAGASCFSWKVRAVCNEDLSSDYSSVRCLVEGQCYAPVSGGGGKPGRVGNNELLNPRVYPNPNAGELYFELKTPESLTLNVEIYNTAGQLVKIFEEEKVSRGFYQNKWLIEESLTDGLYYVLFKTDLGTYQKKVVLARNK